MKLQDRMRLSIRRRAGAVVLRSELAGLGSASQVSHALQALQQQGELIRLGAGVYAKARQDGESGTVRTLADFETLAREVAAKLKMGAPSRAGAVAAQVLIDHRGTLVLDTGGRRVSRKLTLGGRRVAYVNDRTRSRAHPPEPDTGVRMSIPTTGVAQFVSELARKHHVTYAPTPMDQWAETVTQLAGDDVRSGPVQDLLVALKRAGKLPAGDMAALLVNYLRERKQSVRSV